MENNTNSDERILAIEREAKINVIVNHADEISEDTIIISSVFRNMKNLKRFFSWVIILFMMTGVLLPLFQYQLKKEPVKASALLLEDITEETSSRIRSVSTIRKALGTAKCFDEISVESVLENIKINKIELEKNELEAKDSQVMPIEIELSNGFSSSNEKERISLSDDELKLLLEQLLLAYNYELNRTRNGIKLPEENYSYVLQTIVAMDYRESVMALKSLVDKLMEYCRNQPEEVLAYRSIENGLSLYSWIDGLTAYKDLDLDSFCSYIYAAGITKNPELTLNNLQYEQQQNQGKLKSIKDSISNNQSIIENYKVEDVYYFSKENGLSVVPGEVSDEYNKLVYDQMQLLLIEGETMKTLADTEMAVALEWHIPEKKILEVASEKQTCLINNLITLYDGIYKHMKEISQYTSNILTIKNSYPEIKKTSLLASSGKKMIVGAIAGIVIACFFWFVAGLVPELQQDKEKTTKAIREGQIDGEGGNVG